MRNSRRTFILGAGSLASALTLSKAAFAQALPKLSETDPTAQALGYKDDATKVDKAKFTTYVAGQTCSNCQLYQGKPADASGPCPIFVGKSVAAKGWCSSFTKKS
jgi:hypothetical protein